MYSYVYPHRNSDFTWNLWFALSQYWVPLEVFTVDFFSVMRRVLCDNMHYKSSWILTGLWWKCSWLLIDVTIPVNHHHLSLFVWHSAIRFYFKRERHSFLFIRQFLCWALSKISIVSFLYSFSSILSALIKTTGDSAGNPVGLLVVSWSHLFFHCFCLLNLVMLINPFPASQWIPNFPLSAPLSATNWAPLHFP